MGSLRTIFALAVVFTHCLPNYIVFVGGVNAVHLFYIISGFLISFILVETHSYKSLSSFYSNRFLRLYPMYFVVVALTLLANLAAGQKEFFHVLEAVPIGVDILLLVSNCFLFGADWVTFATVKNHALVFPTSFCTREGDVLLFHGQIVTQTWTLGAELSFYLLAPFLLPRKYAMVCVLAVAFAFLMIGGPGVRNPWTYHLFPVDIAFFLIGALSHQILLPFYRRTFGSKLSFVSNVGTMILISISLLYALIPLEQSLKETILFASFIAIIPCAFVFQDRHPWDNWIGNLSYPIYIGHMLLVKSVNYSAKHIGMLSDSVSTVVIIVLSVLFAIVLNELIGKPVEAVRRRFRSSSALRKPIIGEPLPAPAPKPAVDSELAE